MFFDEQFWVAVGFFTFIALIYKPLKKIILTTLDERAKRIRDELEQAMRLREEAQTILVSYQRKQQEAQDEAERIVEQARHEALRLSEQARKDLDEALNRRVESAMQKIAQFEVSMIQDIQEKAIDLAVRSVKQVLSEELSQTGVDNLIDKSIKEIETHFHKQ